MTTMLRPSRKACKIAYDILGNAAALEQPFGNKVSPGRKKVDKDLPQGYLGNQDQIMALASDFPQAEEEFYSARKTR